MPVIARMLANQVDHQYLGPAGVVQIRVAVGQAGAKVFGAVVTDLDTCLAAVCKPSTLPSKTDCREQSLHRFANVQRGSDTGPERVRD